MARACRYVQLPSILPELTGSDGTLHSAIEAGYAHTLRLYANYSIGFLLDRFGIDAASEEDLEACGTLQLSALKVSIISSVSPSVEKERDLEGG